MKPIENGFRVFEKGDEVKYLSQQLEKLKNVEK